jgi:hypothetical protein
MWPDTRLIDLLESHPLTPRISEECDVKASELRPVRGIV